MCSEQLAKVHYLVIKMITKYIILTMFLLELDSVKVFLSLFLLFNKFSVPETTFYSPPTVDIYVVDSPEKDSHIHGSTHDPQYNLQSWIAEMSPG